MHNTDSMGRFNNLLQPGIQSQRPNFGLENFVFRAWSAFVHDGNGKLEDLVIPQPLKHDFVKLKGEIEKDPARDKQEALLEAGQRILSGKILEVRTLMHALPEQGDVQTLAALSPKEQRKLYGKIVDRLERETSYFDEAITAGALRFSKHGFFSKQLKAVIVPVTNKLLQGIIRQPVFLPDIGIILFPGKPPAPAEVVQCLARNGQFPAAFAKLQESVAEILSWPLYKRVGSFLLSAAAGLLTAPLKIAWRLAVTVPRILGISALKRSKLPLFVDPALESAFSALSTELNGEPHLEKGVLQNRYRDYVQERCPELNDHYRNAAIESLMLLRAFGYSMEKIGTMMNGARYDKARAIFPKLEREILRNCRKFKIRTAEDRQHLLDLDDSVWTLSMAASRLKAIRIAREEVIAHEKG